MDKRIKTTETEFDIIEYTKEIVDINGFQFEHTGTEIFIDIYVGEDNKEYLDSFQIKENEDFKIACINWYFNNVEVVKEIKK